MSRTADAESLVDWLHRVAPEDVRLALSQLEAAGYLLETAIWGPSQPFGNGLIKYERAAGDPKVIVSRDRLQWMLSFELPSGEFDLDIIWAVRHGETNWERSEPHDFGAPLPDQLPEGVAWATEIPLAMEWLRSTPEAPTVLKAAQLARADALFGPIRRQTSLEPRRPD